MDQYHGYKLIVGENDRFLWYISDSGILYRCPNGDTKHSPERNMTQIPGTIVNGNLVWTIDGKPYIAKNLMAKRFLRAEPWSYVRLKDDKDPANVALKNLEIVSRAGKFGSRSKAVVVVDHGAQTVYPTASEAAAALYASLPTLLNHLSGKRTCLEKDGRVIRWR